MYSLTLVLHSWWRWVVLVLALVAAARGIAGSTKRRPWTNDDRRVNMFATMALDVQMLFGLLLYVFLSPLTTKAFHDFGAAMRTPSLRYWALDHIGVMLIAVVLAHVGSVRARKATSDKARHLRGALFFGGVVLALLPGMPWPGLASGRPLFRVRI